MTYLQNLLAADGTFVAPAHVLEALPVASARARPCEAPHSLYEELWHLDFWQHFILAALRSEAVAFPEHASDGWPTDNGQLTDEVWQLLVSRFLSELEEAVALAGSPGLDEMVREKVREHLESIAGHNAYHLGRMVLLRQLLHLWPPPSGGDTWW